MRRAPALALLAAASLAPAAEAQGAELRIDGRGFGHGIGMSQYGAYGMALEAGSSYPAILSHYYPGTTLRRARSRRIRVLLKRSSSQKVCGATAIKAGRRRVRLRSGRMYRIYASGDGFRVYDTSARRTKARVAAPARVSGGRSLCLRGRADNGVSNGRYRGDLLLRRDGRLVMAVNRVHAEHYLYGVVPAEMPADWPAEALKAQSVAARSYAYRTMKPGADFDAFADVRSQVYRGVIAERPGSTSATRATRGRILTYGSEVASTFFFSTSGGRTAAIEEVWSSKPVPYLRSVEDPYDRVSPVHTWSVSFGLGEAERRLGKLVRGKLEELAVTEHGPSGRVRTVEVRGSDGTRSASGTLIRSLLGLRSTWFDASVR